MKQKSNIIFMGTPDFALEALKSLVEQTDHRIVCVYTQPPRPAGRGQRSVATPVHVYAEAEGLEVRTPRSLKDREEQEKFHALQADLAVVAAYGLILPQPILDSPQLGCVNIHGSLLPRWRGAAPIQRAIEAGDTQTGITLMQMELGLDTGPMLAKASVPITPQDNAQSLHDTLKDLGATLLIKTLPALLNGTFSPVIQPETGVTYAHKIEKSEGHLDWHQRAEALHAKMQALTPWPGVWFSHNTMRIKVKAADILPQDSTAAPGTVINSKLHIACSRGIFCPTILQKEGGKSMGVKEFLRGYTLTEGTVLS